MAYLTQFSIPLSFNFLTKWRTLRLPYCLWYVRMRSGSKWPMIGPWPCAYAIAYVEPVFTSQSYNISISMSTRRTNLSVFLVLMLMLMLMLLFIRNRLTFSLCSRVHTKLKNQVKQTGSKVANPKWRFAPFWAEEKFQMVMVFPGSRWSDFDFTGYLNLRQERLRFFRNDETRKVR